jgi:hypothetical protein
MTTKMIIGLALLAFLAALFAPDSLFGADSLLAPHAYAFSRAAPAPTPTPLPILPAKVGSNAHLALGALALVLIILFGVALNLRGKNNRPAH